MNTTVQQTTFEQSIPSSYAGSVAKPSLYKRFINWCTSQEQYRFGWLAAALAGHGCIFTPLTMFAIILSGNSIVFWMLAIVAMMAALVTNLAALPTKITIPVFILSILIDLAIIISCVSIGFNISGTSI
jgi:hypothetical protein